MPSPKFDQLLEKYAALAVKVGVNLQPGQRLLARAPIEAAPLVRLITESAYQAGARLVEVFWHDDALTLTRFQYAPRDSFEEFAVWRTDALAAHAKNGDAFLSVSGADPDLLKGQNPDHIALVQKTARTHMAEYYSYIMRNAVNWSIVSMPVPAWAAKIFPDASPEAQVSQLWETIFQVCRIKQPDPVAAWQQHIQDLSARSAYLNRKQYTALKLTAPGTDLTIGLPRGHIWKSAQGTSEAGIQFTPNLPTEEVFTLPHKDRAEGTVTASKPLNYGGTLLENFSLTFEKGRVVKATAGQGEAVLQGLLETDEGARRLGEVALVPHSSPISQANILFYNTLFDENAASHIALGRAYKFTLDGGAAMDDDEFGAAGGNYSLTHVDFMIGSAQMDVDGLYEDGSSEAVMRKGEWAFNT
jgi:aminopeptidase